MRPFADIEAEIEALARAPEGPEAAAYALLAAGEEILEGWISARGAEPTEERKEGFRLLALHRQGANADPSFNACRETCRELVYHYNLIQSDPAHGDIKSRVRMAAYVARHLCYFIGGKLEETGLGEFCCSSKQMRAGAAQG